MFRWIYHIPLLLSITQTLVLVGAQFATETCVEDNHRKKSTQLDCNDGCISDVNVESGDGRCLKDDGKCVGMTPSLMVGYMNCYWRNGCLIDWPRDPIIYMPKPSETGRTCVGRLPTFMSISYKCFKPTDYKEDNGFSKFSGKDVEPKRLLIDVCNNLEGAESVYKWVGDSNVAGIIRSHKLYPWDYSDQARNCSVKIYWHTKRKLVVKAKNIDLSEDDRLTIENKNEHPVNVISDNSFNFTDGTVTTFVFRVGAESNSGKGFLLCFKFIDSDETLTDVCESIMTTGTVTNVEPDTDGLGSLPLHPDTTSTIATTTHAVTTTPQIPPRCLKRKTEKARLKCAKRRKKKGKPSKKNKRKRKGRKKNRKDRRKRRHSIRRNK